MSVVRFDHLLGEDCHSPVVFHHAIDNWPARKWTEKYLAVCLQDRQFQCKISPRDHEEVLMETDCLHVQCSLQEYDDWLSGKTEEDNPLFEIDHFKYSCYIDYKYMKDVFCGSEEVLKEVSWERFGFPGRDGKDSTLWVGSEGAYTPCHQDIYGFNLVAQIKGRKRWYLFPPNASSYIYPTRIPFEESSVFSEVNIRFPDLKKHPLFQKAEPYITILHPGEVLYVPRHWWHFVECLEPSISVNTWVEMQEDVDSHLEEAVTRFMFTNMASLVPCENLLDSYEELESPDINIQYVHQAMEAVLEARKEKKKSKQITHEQSEHDVIKAVGEQTDVATKLQSIAEACCQCQLVDNFLKFSETFKGHMVSLCDGNIDEICSGMQLQKKRKRHHSYSIQNDNDSMNVCSKSVKFESKTSPSEKDVDKSKSIKNKCTGIGLSSVASHFESTETVETHKLIIESKTNKSRNEEQDISTSMSDIRTNVNDQYRIVTVPQFSFDLYLKFLKFEFNYVETIKMDIKNREENKDESAYIDQMNVADHKNNEVKESYVHIMNSILDHNVVSLICDNLLKKHK